jgi:TATA-binding protein-associated factor
MSLQKFKLTIANTVISQENSSLQTMATDQLLDLFTLDSSHASASTEDKHSSRGVKSILENLPDLWEESAYESEYDLSSFIQSLK